MEPLFPPKHSTLTTGGTTEGTSTVGCAMVVMAVAKQPLASVTLTV